MANSLAAADITLRRASPADLDAIVALQRAAYAGNRALLGVEPLPLLADYKTVLAEMEAWCVDRNDTLAGVLILEPAPDHLLLWSIATNPSVQSKGLGNKLLAAAEVRARELGVDLMRLYTGTVLKHLTGWYARHGYVTDRIEQMPDRSVTHMSKRLAKS